MKNNQSHQMKALKKTIEATRLQGLSTRGQVMNNKEAGSL
jgi:hypothetical protein